MLKISRHRIGFVVVLEFESKRTIAVIFVSSSGGYVPTQTKHLILPIWIARICKTREGAIEGQRRTFSREDPYRIVPVAQAVVYIEVKLWSGQGVSDTQRPHRALTTRVIDTLAGRGRLDGALSRRKAKIPELRPRFHRNGQYPEPKQCNQSMYS